MIEATLLADLIAFRKERDWEQFHTPKELAISLSIEAAELLEWFQWKSQQQLNEQYADPDKRTALENEVADVAIYLSYLCHDVGIDINQAVANKLQHNAEKYPIEKVKGRNDKYSDYR